MKTICERAERSIVIFQSSGLSCSKVSSRFARRLTFRYNSHISVTITAMISEKRKNVIDPFGGAIFSTRFRFFVMVVSFMFVI